MRGEPTEEERGGEVSVGRVMEGGRGEEASGGGKEDNREGRSVVVINDIIYVFEHLTWLHIVSLTYIIKRHVITFWMDSNNNNFSQNFWNFRNKKKLKINCEFQHKH